MAVDRGRAKYFHGRKEEIEKFKDLLTRSIKDKVGTTFLIQGSPGVGKSALKFELSKRAKNWHVIEIDPTALYDLKDFRDSLGLENWFEFWKNEVIHLKGSVSSVNIDLKIPLTRHTFRKSLNEIKKPTLIVLDEAQRLKEEVKDVSEKKQYEMF